MHRFIGPVKILNKISKVAYELETAVSVEMHDVFPASLLRLYRKRPELGEEAPPAMLPSLDLEEEVADVLDHDDDIDGECRYQVKWVDHGDVELEPGAHLLNIKEKVQAYFDRHHLAKGAKLLRKKRAAAAQLRAAEDYEDSIAKRDLTTPDLNEGSLKCSPTLRMLMTLIAAKVDRAP